MKRNLYYYLILFLFLSACSSKPNDDSTNANDPITSDGGDEYPLAVDSVYADSSSTDDEFSGTTGVEDELDSSDNVLEEQDITFCCTNHKPSHCGTSAELASLTKQNGCSGF